MSVYVGPEFNVVRTDRSRGYWPYPYASHLFADDLDELHRLANRIGLRRRWFQRKSVMPHYDLTRNKRREAIMAGALIASSGTEAVYIRKWRSSKGESS